MFVIAFKITNKLVIRLKEVIHYLTFVFSTSIHFSGVIAHADSYIVKFRENVFFFPRPILRSRVSRDKNCIVWGSCTFSEHKSKLLGMLTGIET